jgi:hypothetical protein
MSSESTCPFIKPSNTWILLVMDSILISPIVWQRKIKSRLFTRLSQH